MWLLRTKQYIVPQPAGQPNLIPESFRDAVAEEGTPLAVKEVVMPTGGDGDCTMWKTSIRGGWWLTSAPKHVRHATRTLESGVDKSADDYHNNRNHQKMIVLLTKQW